MNKNKFLPFTLFATLVIAGCGGGGSESSGTPAPPTSNPPPTPIPSSLFTDNSANLPSSSAQSCFDVNSTDVDGDGDLDIVLAAINLTGSAATGEMNKLYINDGAGNFSDSSNQLPNNNRLTEHVEAADFDGDGDVDLIFANLNAQHEYYLNDGAGVFTNSVNDLPVTGFTSSAVAIDIDNDTDLDLLLTNFGDSELLLNDGSGNFSIDNMNRIPSDPEITEDSAIGDINGDTFPDIMISYRGSNSEGEQLQNQLWINEGAGIFANRTATNMPTLLNSTFDSIFADMDGDGDMDALIANATIGNSNVALLDHILINDGSGVFTDETSNRWPQANLSNSYGIKAQDLDRDGDLDIIIAENIGVLGSGTVRAYQNNGQGNFTEQTNQLVGEVIGNFSDLEVADFNNDGLLDIYFCAASNGGTADSGRDFLFLGQ